MENNFGQVFKLSKGLTNQAENKGKLVWDETFQVNTNRLGAEDTVTLKFLKAPFDDILFLDQKSVEGQSFMEHQSRSSTGAYTNAEGSFTEDPNLYGFAKIQVSQMARSSYFSDWFKLMNTSNKVIGKVLVKTQFVKMAVQVPINKAPCQKKVSFDEENLELFQNSSEEKEKEDSFSMNNSFQSTYKGPLKNESSAMDQVKDSNSLTLAGHLLRRHKEVS